MRKVKSGTCRNWASALWPVLGVLALLCGVVGNTQAKDVTVGRTEIVQHLSDLTGTKILRRVETVPHSGPVWVYILQSVKPKVIDNLPPNQTVEVTGIIGTYGNVKNSYNFHTDDNANIVVKGDFPSDVGSGTRWTLRARVSDKLDGKYTLSEIVKAQGSVHPLLAPGYTAAGTTPTPTATPTKTPKPPYPPPPPPVHTTAWYQEPMILLGGLLILAALATLGALLAKNSSDQKRRLDDERRQRELADQRVQQESARQAALQEAEAIRADSKRVLQATAPTVPASSPPVRDDGGTLVSVGSLKALSGPHAGDSFPLVIGENRIGRSAENGVKLDRDREVSGNHASLVVSHGGGPVVFKDASSNGSRVDGQSIHHNQVNLSPNAKLEVGASTLQLSMRNAGAASAPPVATPSASGRGGDTVVVGAPVNSASTPAASSTMLGYTVALEIVDGPDKGKPLFTLTKKKITIGRENADLLLSDPTVSSSHATLSMDGGRCLLADNNSTNGTRLNDVPVDATGRELKEGDRIALGKGTTVLVFHRYN